MALTASVKFRIGSPKTTPNEHRPYYLFLVVFIRAGDLFKAQFSLKFGYVNPSLFLFKM